jgi:hypothetical protein
VLTSAQTVFVLEVDQTLRDTIIGAPITYQKKRAAQACSLRAMADTTR